MGDEPSANPQTVPDPPAKSEPAPGTGPRERPTPEGDGLDPTRFGDWEKNGRCIDF